MLPPFQDELKFFNNVSRPKLPYAVTSGKLKIRIKLWNNRIGENIFSGRSETAQ
jgi:hypothetical protein